LEAIIATDNGKSPIAQRLQTLPGVGQILAPVIALEIDDITRFGHPDKLCAYAGLVPTTHASGGKIAHGRMLPFCNRWLKWAFTEAAWVAVGCSDYFGSFYRKQRLRGKGANDAITIAARRMAKIDWKMLTDERGLSAPARGVIRRYGELCANRSFRTWSRWKRGSWMRPAG
jgi:transposase